MENIIEIYNDNIIFVFEKKHINIDKEYLVVIKNECEKKEIENTLVMHYNEDFEQYLHFKLPDKIRKEKKLLSLNDSYQILEDIHYGVLSFMAEDYPYSIGINHINYNHRIFFHCGLKGYKLNGIGKNVTFTVIDDLGINLELGTNNFKETIIFGKLKLVEDFDLKKTVLLKLVSDLAPKHPYNDKMLEYTNILELEIDYISGKMQNY
jgi:Predicted flavin-nucleotide-binding protein